MIAAAAATGARIALLTETFSTGFSMDIATTGEPVGGPSSAVPPPRRRSTGSGSAVRARSWPDGSEKPFNTFVLAGPDGTQHRYRKIHPFTYGGEDRSFQRRRELVTVTIEGLRVSLFVCYDLRFADEWWQLARATDAVPARR